MAKKCPYCAEEIQDEAIKCKHCQSWLTGEASQNSQLLGGGGLGTNLRLRRSSTNRVLAGVCGGLAESLGIDPVILRVVYAVVSFFTAIVPGIILYVVLALVIPSDQEPLGPLP